jgi:uncharacterized membrane protein
MTTPSLDSSPSYQPSQQAPTQQVRTLQLIAIFSLLGLIILGLIWELWLAPLKPGGSLLAIKVLPLCIPLAGLLKNRMYTFRWVSLLVWLYFIEGTVRGYSDPFPSRYFAWIEIALCLILFTACAVYVRIRLRNGKLLAAQAINATETETAAAKETASTH